MAPTRSDSWNLFSTGDFRQCPNVTALRGAWQSAGVTEEGLTAPETIAGVPRSLALVYAGAVVTVPEGLLNLIVGGAVEVDGTSLTVVDSNALLFVLAGIALSLAIIAYVVQIRGDPTKRNYLVVGWLAIGSLLVGTLFLHFLTLLGASLGYWQGDDD